MTNKQVTKSTTAGNITVLAGCGSLGAIGAGFLTSGKQIFDPGAIPYQFVAIGILFSLIIASSRYLTKKQYLFLSPLLALLGVVVTRAIFADQSSVLIRDGVLVAAGVILLPLASNVKSSIFLKVVIWGIDVALCYVIASGLYTLILHEPTVVGFKMVGIYMGIGIAIGLFMGDIINVKPNMSVPSITNS